MELNDKSSPEELLNEIKRLKTENEILRDKLNLSDESHAGRESVVSNRTSCFKNKYATKILESLPDMLTVINNEGTIVELVSSEETNHVGASGSEIVNKDMSEVIPQDAYINVKNNLDWVVAHNKGSIANHNLYVDGILHHYENRIFPLDGQNVLCICRDVTEAVDSKEELLLANQRMKMAEKIASLSHWLFYPAKRELEAPGILPLLLKTDDVNVRIKIEDYLEYIHPDDRQSLRKLFSEVEINNDVVEHRVILDGKVRYFHTRIICEYEKNGELILEGYAQDMTYIVERLYELEVVKYAVSNATEEIFSCGLDGTIEFANVHFMKHQNIVGEFSNYKLYELNSSIKTLPEWTDKILAMRNNGGSLKYSAQYISDSGRKHAFEVSCYIIGDRLGEEKVWFFSRDVSERVEREEKIKELNYLMDAILNNIPVYLFVKDPSNDFRYLYWNKAFEEYSHIPASVALGKTDFEIFSSQEEAQRFRTDDLELLKSREHLEFLESYTAANGEKRIVNTSKALVPSENKLPLIIGVAWDITELKNVENELIAARLRAEQSDRLKTAFLANMSHEIRTPLNAIVGFSKLIADAEALEEKNEYSEIINRNSEMLLQLINDILDISKIEAGMLEFIDKPIDIVELCRNIYEVSKGRVQDGVTLNLCVQEDCFPILSDWNRISQVLTNLVTNACKFTAKGEISVGFLRDGEVLDFFVKDTGIGISKEKITNIFDRFIKLDAFAQGTGLGLAISKMIAEKMNGSLTVESKEGIGSEFHFRIPYVHGDIVKKQKLEEKAPLSKKISAIMKKRILVAEDVESNYLLLKAVLGKEYELIRAVNGKEAIVKFNECAPDLILMDIKMPEMNGLDATKAIREYSTEVPIIALTAFAFDADKESALNAGCNGFLTKPISRPELLRVLNEYLSN